MKKATLWVLPLSLLLIAGGTALYYVNGYKDTLWVKAPAYLLIIFGWLLIFFVPVLLIIPSGSGTKQKIKGWQKLLLGVGFFFMIAALIANFLLADEWMKNRVFFLLSTQPSTNTEAFVVRKEQRRGKASSHVFAIIQYQTPGGEVTQAVSDDYSYYRAGQMIDITYSNDYPDMFVVRK